MKYNAEHAEKALEIVNRLLPRVTLRPEYAELVAVLEDHERWHEAHALFNRIRVNITLPTEAHKGKDKGMDDYFVYVAENAAKTAYNCCEHSERGRSAPFDNESFDRLIKAERDFLANLAVSQDNKGEQDIAPSDR